MERLDPKLDVVFKLLFTREPALLIDMLQGILARAIEDLTVLNPGIPGELANDKEVVFDIRAQLEDGSRVDLEMQIRTHPALTSRLVYYAARDYADQLAHGADYGALTPTVVVVWLVKPLFAELDRLHSIFELRERHTHTLFGDQLAIHLLQLQSASPSDPRGYDATVGRWARFLIAQDEAELTQLASEDPIMAIAQQNLNQLSQDPATRRLARERADAVKLYKLDLVASEAKGRLEGKAEFLLKQLRLRFGSLPQATRARIEAARPEELDAWAERVLVAKTLDEMFG